MRYYKVIINVFIVVVFPQSLLLISHSGTWYSALQNETQEEGPEWLEKASNALLGRIQTDILASRLQTESEGGIAAAERLPLPSRPVPERQPLFEVGVISCHFRLAVWTREQVNAEKIAVTA
jgi:hypothetical protein